MFCSYHFYHYPFKPPTHFIVERYHCPQFIKKKLFQHLPQCWVYSESIINSSWIDLNTLMTKLVELKDAIRRLLLGPQLAAFVPLALSSLILNSSVEYQLWRSCKIYSNRTKKKMVQQLLIQKNLHFSNHQIIEGHMPNFYRFLFQPN